MLFYGVKLLIFPRVFITYYQLYHGLQTLVNTYVYIVPSSSSVTDGKRIKFTNGPSNVSFSNPTRPDPT